MIESVNRYPVPEVWELLGASGSFRDSLLWHEVANPQAGFVERSGGRVIRPTEEQRVAEIGFEPQNPPKPLQTRNQQRPLNPGALLLP